MRLSKGVSKQGRKKSNKRHKVNKCKVEIVYKLSPSKHIRLFKALSILLNQEDILDYFVPQENSQKKAKKPPKKKKDQGFHRPECMSTSPPIDKCPSKALGLNNEEAK